MNWENRFLSALKNRVQLRGWLGFDELNYDQAMKDLLAKDRLLAVRSTNRMFVAGDVDVSPKTYETHSFTYIKESAILAHCHKIFGKDGEYPIDTFNRMIKNSQKNT